VIERERRNDVLACAALSALWLIPLLVIGTQGEFPLNDDWAYALTTKGLIETGRFERDAWTWAPIISHVGTGALFSLILGFSFETLRLSGVFMGWVGLLGSYGLFRQCGAGPRSSFLAAAVVGLNPLYLHLSYTFMTDVPFAAVTTWSLLFLFRGLSNHSWKATVVGVLLALFATLSRQPGLAIPLAFGIALVAARPASLRQWLLPLGLCALLGVGYVLGPLLVFGPGDSGRLYTLRSSLTYWLLSPNVHYHLLRNGLTAFNYMGLFVSPIAVLFLPLNARAGLCLLLASAAVGGLAAFGVGLAGLPMPLGINVIHDVGLGPYTIAGAASLPRAPAWVWPAVTAVGFTGGLLAAGLILAGTWGRFRSVRTRAEWLLLLIFPAAYVVPLLIRTPCFDRYFLTALPSILALLLALPGRPGRPSRPAGALAILLLAMLATYGLVGTRDYLQHHRARWAILEDLLEQGVSPDRVDGGFEFTGWFNFELDPSKVKPRPDWAFGNEFLLSYADRMPGYRPIARRAYRRLLPPRSEVLTLFERLPSETPATEGSLGVDG
jgi:4-amino-4-deoxy-L-arabinose transferase-like glycosyltransferase